MRHRRILVAPKWQWPQKLFGGVQRRRPSPLRLMLGAFARRVVTEGRWTAMFSSLASIDRGAVACLTTSLTPISFRSWMVASTYRGLSKRDYEVRTGRRM